MVLGSKSFNKDPNSNKENNLMFFTRSYDCISESKKNKIEKRKIMEHVFFLLIKGYNFKLSTKLANLQEDEVEVVVPIQHRLMEVVEVVGKAMEEGVVAVALVDQAFLDVHVQEVQEAFRAFLKNK